MATQYGDYHMSLNPIIQILIRKPEMWHLLGGFSEERYFGMIELHSQTLAYGQLTLTGKTESKWPQNPDKMWKMTEKAIDTMNRVCKLLELPPYMYPDRPRAEKRIQELFPIRIAEQPDLGI